MEYVLNIIGLLNYSFKRALAPLVFFGRHVYDHFIPHARNNYHPHILGHRALALFSGLLVTVKIFTIALIAWGPIVPAFSSAITAENIINLTNQSRQQFSEQSLVENSLLDQAAQAKADDMLAKGYFAHVTPDGRTPWSFITAAGYSYLEAGENLAVNFSQAEDVETAWMNSPGHRANLLNKDFQDIGIGISEGQYQSHTAIFVVQEFGTPAEQQVTLSNKPTPVQTTAVPAPAQPSSVQPQVRSANSSSQPSASAAPATAPAAAANANNVSAAPVILPVSVQSGNIQLVGDNVNITAQVSGPAAKVIAYFGQQAIMLSPTSQDAWAGQVAASQLTQSSVTVHLEAFNMQGQSSQLQLADFAPSTIENYNLSGSTPAAYANFLGATFNPNVFASQFYLLFIAALLSCLILAIAMKKHVQHLSLIANSSFVVILAVLMWWGG